MNRLTQLVGSLFWAALILVPVTATIAANSTPRPVVIIECDKLTPVLGVLLGTDVTIEVDQGSDARCVFGLSTNLSKQDVENVVSSFFQRNNLPLKGVFDQQKDQLTVTPQ
jgi:hypothetical protein